MKQLSKLLSSTVKATGSRGKVGSGRATVLFTAVASSATRPVWDSTTRRTRVFAHDFQICKKHVGCCANIRNFRFHRQHKSAWIKCVNNYSRPHICWILSIFTPSFVTSEEFGEARRMFIIPIHTAEAHFYCIFSFVGFWAEDLQ